MFEDEDVMPSEPKNSELTIKPDEKINKNLPAQNFVEAMTDNSVAAEIARQKNADIKNQEKIANKINKVVQQNTNVDIDTADVFVAEKDKNNKVKRQGIKNELLKLRKEKLFIRREENHRLKMQKLSQRKQKYGELLTRHKKITYDNEGNSIINMPNGFVLFFMIVLDSFVNFLNLFTEILGKTNKAFLKGFLIILVLLFVFISPFREWMFGLIGMK